MAQQAVTSATDGGDCNGIVDTFSNLIVNIQAISLQAPYIAETLKSISEQKKVLENKDKAKSEQIVDLQKEIAASGREIEAWKQQSHEQERMTDRAKNENDMLRRKIGEFERKVTSFESQLQASERESQERISVLENERKVAKIDIQNLQRNIDQSKDMIKNLEDDVKNYQFAMESLKNCLKLTNQKAKKLQKRNEKLQVCKKHYDFLLSEKMKEHQELNSDRGSAEESAESDEENEYEYVYNLPFQPGIPTRGSRRPPLRNYQLPRNAINTQNNRSADGRALPEVPTTSAGIQAHDDVISVTSSSSNQSTLRSSASDTDDRARNSAVTHV
ncbi:uncharacterized protein LOC143459099 isoform X2 [Clavelina lepadiformis]|uniref:uncharacterized protein LOC143459099 isoform X2 n=1 Tax=Clavelina lepadiformis TaxID=159417 RepID=UPI004042A48B